ncbi:uncharacterized protein LOC110683170 [Chenopodium quinoa]|uniref:uncharacterized protein LOC110683170 n=1 Tax=Chenopodium quinoa TaxID=63459 RepID=UPI000B79092A|nr:uncharacterized protein LOC110683170 [Chenopodium quinoa]
MCLDKEVKPNSLRTWDEVTKEFLFRFYPQKKTVEERTLIQSFKQKPSESLFKPWERYKEYQRECPHHGIPTYQIIQFSMEDIAPEGKSCLDAGAGGPIMNKTEEEVVDIIEDVVRHYMDWKEGERGVYKQEWLNCLFASQCNQKLFFPNLKLGEGDDIDQSQARENQGNQGFRGNYSNQGYSNQNQNQGYGNQGHYHGFGGQKQNFGNNQGRGNWNNQSRGNFPNNNQRGPPPGFAPRSQGNGDNSCAQPPSSKNTLEEIIENQTKILNTYMSVSDKKFNEMMTHNKMLETQITQLANTLKDCASPSSLPSQGVDSKKPIYSITIRSGRMLEERVSCNNEEDEKKSDSNEEKERDVSKSVSK